MTNAFQLTQSIKTAIEGYRHEVRSLGTLGGCYQVSLFIEHFYKLPMCEGVDIAIIDSAHELFQRYRPQWSSSLNPKVTPWLSHIDWLEVTDVDWKKQNPNKQIPDGYWLKDNSDYLKWRSMMAANYEVYR